MLKNKFYFYVFLSLILFISGCATVPRRRAAGLKDKEAYLKDLCERHAILWQWDPVAQVVSVDVHGTNARLLVGSDILLLGKERVQLSAPVRIRQSSLIVPSDFKAKVFGSSEKALPGRGALRIHSGQAYSIRKVREVVIDPGHGGKDPGARGLKGTREKEVVLDIARRLKKILERGGIRVIMTRDDDTFISLKERTEITSRPGADLFISIHANSSPGRGVQGVEVFSLADLGVLEKNEAQRQENQQMMFKALAMKRNPASVEDIVADMLYTYKQAVSSELAYDVAGKVARSTKTKNRGQKRARFFVLRNTLIPAVLAEVGFLSNPKEEKLLNTASYRQKVADGLAKSILEYANGK
jgi:N-acetylmuramoyl-L-alanine amidase